MTLIGHFISQQEIRHKFGEGQKCTKLVDAKLFRSTNKLAHFPVVM